MRQHVLKLMMALGMFLWNHFAHYVFYLIEGTDMHRNKIMSLWSSSYPNSNYKYVTLAMIICDYLAVESVSTGFVTSYCKISKPRD